MSAGQAAGVAGASGFVGAALAGFSPGARGVAPCGASATGAGALVLPVAVTAGPPPLARWRSASGFAFWLGGAFAGCGAALPAATAHAVKRKANPNRRRITRFGLPRSGGVLPADRRMLPSVHSAA